MCSTSNVPSFPGPEPGVLGATFTAVQCRTEFEVRAKRGKGEGGWKMGTVRLPEAKVVNGRLQQRGTRCLVSKDLLVFVRTAV